MSTDESHGYGAGAVTFNPLVLTDAHSFIPMKRHSWATAVDYLLSHAGRWVPSVEIADFVYSGACARHAPHMLIARAKRAGVPIESSVLGYRIGRNLSLACPDCGMLRVRYPDGELVCYGCVGTEFVDLEVGRTPYDPTTRQGKAWTQQELQFIRDNRNHMSNVAMAEVLNRTESGGARTSDEDGTRSQAIHEG